MGSWHSRMVWLAGLAILVAAAPAHADEQESVWFRTLDEPSAEVAEAPESIEFDELDQDPRALVDFRPVLDPHGDWHQDPRFGLIWSPHQHVVGADFAPYLTHGRWALDTSGNWVWVSDFSFGPVVFHYGRWVWIHGLGWSWVPGYRYAPAWVVWRVPGAGGHTLGWAPMPPSFVWVNGFAVGVGFEVTVAWVFCPSRYAFSPHLEQHRLRGRLRQQRAARRTHVYHARDGLNGPPLRVAGVPAHQAPPVLVPAQPLPAPRSASGGWSRPGLGSLGAAPRSVPEVARDARPSPQLSTELKPIGASRRGALPRPPRPSVDAGTRGARPTPQPERRAFAPESSSATPPVAERSRAPTVPPEVRRPTASPRSDPRAMPPRPLPRVKRSPEQARPVPAKPPSPRKTGPKPRVKR